MCGCLLHAPYWGLTHNPGMCPDWESNLQPFGLQAGTQSTEPYQSGLYICFIRICQEQFAYFVPCQQGTKVASVT